MMNKFFVACAVFMLIALASSAQKITYSQPERDDVRSVDFDIVGKINNHYLVYKRVRSSYNISLYDDEMKLIDKVNMDFLPDKLINSEIIPYKDYFYFVYQYQKRNIVNCAAAKIGGDGKIIGEPVTLDTTAISFFASNKIYNLLYSEDKQRIALYKINSKDDQKYIFTSRLFDASLNSLSKFTAVIPMQAHNDFLTEFTFDNSGTIAFVKASGNSDASTVQKISLMIKDPDDDKIDSYPLDIGKIYLGDIRVKADNLNNHFLIAGFYSKQRRGNIDGMYCAIWDKNTEANNGIKGNCI